MAADVTIVFAPAGPGPDQIRSVLERLSQFAVLNSAHVFWVAAADDLFRLTTSRTWEQTTSVQDDLALLRCESACFIALDLSEQADAMTAVPLDFSDVRYSSEQIRLPPGLSPTRWRLVVPRDGTDRALEDPLPGWTTVVAAPENRFSDRHPPAELKIRAASGPGDYFGHAAAHVATLAGLWRNDHVDLFGDQFGQIHEDAAITQRVFSRSVVGIDVGDEIIEPLLAADIHQWPPPTPSALSTDVAVPHPSPPDLVQNALLRLGEDPTFRYSGPEPYRPPNRTRISILDALRIFWSRLRGAISDLPHVFAADVKERLERTAQSLTAALTGLGGDGSTVTFRAERVFDADYGSPAEMLERIGAPIFVQSTPTSWRTLRSLCFGLIDADPHSQATELATVDGRRTVLTDPSLIAPAPGVPCDPRRARSGVPAKESPEEGPDEDTALEAMANESNTANEMGRSQSVLWRLGVGIDAEALRAAEDFVRAFQILATPKEDSEELKKAEHQLRRLRRWGRVGGLTIVAVLAYAGYQTSQVYGRGKLEIADNLAEITPATWTLLALIVGVLIGLVLYIREELRIRYRLDEYHRRLRWAQGALTPALSELHRLDNVYTQYLGWASIISAVVHRPWGAADLEESKWARPTFDSHELPHSLMVVYGSAGEVTDPRLRVGVEAELTRVGWLGRTYREVTEEALARRAIEQRMVNDERSDPDEDVPTTPNGARTWLADAYNGGLAASISRRRGRRSAIAFLLNLDPVETLPELEPGWHRPELLVGLSTSDLLREQVTSTPPPLDQSLFRPSGQQQGARDVVDTASFLPAPLRGDCSRIETDESSTDLTLVSVRVDLSGSTPKRDYLALAPDVDPSPVIDLNAPSPADWADASREPDSPI